jgi:hypothetical protein
MLDLGYHSGDYKGSNPLDLTPCSSVKIHSLPGGICRLHLQDKKVS